MEHYQELIKRIARLEQSYDLGQLNPLKAGGTADYFTVAQDTVELAVAVKAAIDLQIPYMVIGEGRSVLFSDGGFPGLVIQNKTSSLSLAAEHSQVVVDSGLPLSQFITRAASHGLGGLTSFYGEPGTVGAAVYCNLRSGNQELLSSLRFVTLLMPPARLDREATILRHKTDWLQKNSLLERKKTEGSSPVILTAVFQLTSVRQDELRLRLQRQAAERGKAAGLGPIFDPVPGVPDLEVLLRGAGAEKLQVANLRPWRNHPNYVLARSGAVSSSDIRTLIGEMQAAVQARFGVELACRYEYLGVW